VCANGVLVTIPADTQHFRIAWSFSPAPTAPANVTFR